MPCNTVAFASANRVLGAQLYRKTSSLLMHNNYLRFPGKLREYVAAIHSNIRGDYKKWSSGRQHARFLQRLSSAIADAARGHAAKNVDLECFFEKLTRAARGPLPGANRIPIDDLKQVIRDAATMVSDDTSFEETEAEREKEDAEWRSENDEEEVVVKKEDVCE